MNSQLTTYNYARASSVIAAILGEGLIIINMTLYPPTCFYSLLNLLCVSEVRPTVVRPLACENG